MKRNSFQPDSPLANTNAPSVVLDALVADVLEHNPELNFYRAEIAAAKGERRTAATWANPELAGTVGDKRVTDSSFVGEGVAWSVSVRQPFEWPGRIPLRKAIANHQVKLAALGFDQFKRVGVSISMPLPLWNRNKGSVQTAEARQQQAETSLYVTRRDIERRIVEKALTYQTKLAEMAKWRPESVEEFRKAAELADRHYRLGAVPIATYVELQKQYLEAVEALLDTKREALEAGQELQRLTGLDFNAAQSAKPAEGKQ